MKNMKFAVTDLTTLIQKNREEHRSIFLEALEGYRRKIAEHLNQMVTDLKAGKRISHYITLAQPSDHTKDYDRVLQMLAMTTEEVIELNEQEFGQYVRDEWQWKANFASSNRSYSAKAALLAQEYDTQ